MFKKSFRHWTTRYIINRFRVMLYKLMHPNSPWFCKDAVRILDSQLKPKHRGLEWDSGRSSRQTRRRGNVFARAKIDEINLPKFKTDAGYERNQIAFYVFA